MEWKRGLGVSLSPTLSSVIWGNWLISLSLSFPWVSITGSCEGSDETMYKLCLFKKYTHVDSLPLVHTPRPSSVQVYLCSTFTAYLRPHTYFSCLIPFVIIIGIRELVASFKYFLFYLNHIVSYYIIL